MSDISDKWELNAARVAPQTRTTPVARRTRAQSTGTCIPAHVLVVLPLRLLQILEKLDPLLSPDLPTASSSRSPAPGSKRNSDHLGSNQDNKRQRVAADAGRRYEHSVESVDDSRQQPQHPVHHAVQAPMPIVRPRRRLERSNELWTRKAAEYRELARKLKFSGEAHNAASFAPSSSASSAFGSFSRISLFSSSSSEPNACSTCLAT